jgi:hypothetical protein
VTQAFTTRFVGRPSAVERERAADVLRHACAEERVSPDTLARRLDLVYAARTRMELDRLTADVAEPGPVRRAALAAVAWVSRSTHDLGAAWRAPRTPRLMLPRRAELVIGRSPWSDFVVADPAVSHRHALLTYTAGTWTLADAGSTNGTFVNGWRIADPIVVRPGDELLLGRSRFILAPPD